MVFILRFICLSLMMIVGNLVLPGINLGGRYLILLEALMATMLAQLFHHLLQGRISHRYQSILAGFSILIGLFMIQSLFPGVNLSFMGILFLYLGAVLLELILPNPAFYDRPSNDLS